MTACDTFQSALVKVSDTGAAVPSLASLDERVMTTSASGWVFSTTENVAVPPLSVVTRPAVGVTLIPGAPTGVTFTVSVFATAANAGPLVSCTLKLKLA